MEVLRAKWHEIDFDKAQWDIPAERMKSRRPHRVYLSRQALEVLEVMQAISGEGEYVFPSPQIASVPLADATLNHFFKRLDFGVPDFSPHGTRGTAATLLREHGFSRDVVELLLAHTEQSQTAASYHHHELEAERRKALQYLADEPVSLLRVRLFIDRNLDHEGVQLGVCGVAASLNVSREVDGVTLGPLSGRELSEYFDFTSMPIKAFSRANLYRKLSWLT